MKRTYEQERHETDRLDLIHHIVHKAQCNEWDEVERYKALYTEIYGLLPGNTAKKSIALDNLDSQLSNENKRPSYPWEKF